MHRHALHPLFCFEVHEEISRTYTATEQNRYKRGSSAMHLTALLGRPGDMLD